MGCGVPRCSKFITFLCCRCESICFSVMFTSKEFQEGTFQAFSSFKLVWYEIRAPSGHSEPGLQAAVLSIVSQRTCLRSPADTFWLRMKGLRKSSQLSPSISLFRAESTYHRQQKIGPQKSHLPKPIIYLYTVY